MVTSCSSSRISPLQVILPDTSILLSLGTRGRGRSTEKSYNEGLFCLPISRTSLNPLFVINVTRAPFLWRTAFVPTVIPWTTLVYFLVTLSIPCMTPSAKSWGVVGTFETLISPSETKTVSVKVPPTSDPTIIDIPPGAFPGVWALPCESASEHSITLLNCWILQGRLVLLQGH